VGISLYFGVMVNQGWKLQSTLRNVLCCYSEYWRKWYRHSLENPIILH